ncbi:MAG TPA: hypothetical protein VHX12_11495, partial [Acidisoma sp.]|nr:hypothetical protein [Acidisoma sp.]
LQLKPDLFMTQRYAVPDQEAARALLTHARRAGTPLLYDLDDDLIALPPDHPEAERLRPRNAGVAALLGGANQIHVSTDILADRIGPLVRGGRGAITVMPNGLDEGLWSLTGESAAGWGGTPHAIAGVQSGPVRILYMGTATHGADLDLILPALVRLHESFGERIAIELVGIVGPHALPPFLKRLDVPRRAGLSYPAFVSWLSERQRREPWAIGLAPLVDTPFNGCKSAIKMLDYAALGLPVVASAVAAYTAPSAACFAQPLSLDGVEAGGYFASDEAQWFHAIARLVRRPDLRAAMAALGHRALMQDGTLAAQAACRRAALATLAGRQTQTGSGPAAAARGGASVPTALPAKPAAAARPASPATRSRKRVLSPDRA